MTSGLKLPASVHVFERGWLSSNNVLFADDEANVLVDSGYHLHAEQTLALVRHALGAAPLHRIVNTHLHSDHCGGNALLQDTYACRITIPQADEEAVRDWNEDALTFRAMGQRCSRFGFHDSLKGGETLRLGGLDWRVLFAPGHDPHGFMLHCEREGLLISADALWENGFGVIFPELEGEPGFAEASDVLSLIGQLDVRLVIPGHGAPFTDVAGALERARRRLDYLAADALRNAHNGAKVLVKFRLLARRQVALNELVQWMSEVPLLAAINQRYLQMSDRAMAQWLAEQLVKVGAARWNGQTLEDA